MISDNYFLGSNELAIRYRSGRYVVLERYEDYEVVFEGHYEDCVRYCKDRWTDYMESLIG